MDDHWTRRSILARIPALAFLPGMLSIGGCDSDEGQTSESRSISFTDLAGNEISLAKPVERIVDLCGVTAAVALAVHGSPSRLVGIHPFTKATFRDSFISRLFPDILAIPSDVVVSGTYAPNVESIARLNPDVVIQYGDHGADMIAPIENVGLTVARFQALHGKGETLEDTLTALLTMFGAMIGDTSRSDRVIRLGAEIFARMPEAIASLPDDRRARALIITPQGDALFASGGKASSAYHIYRAGGTNVAHDIPDFTAIGAEQIAAWSPDIIFIFNSGAGPSRIFDDPILGSIPAAQNRRVYVLPTGSYAWGSLGPEDALTQLWMAELLYPDQMSHLLRDEMRGAYRLMFNFVATDAELNDILLADVNGGSANYERFLQ